MSSINEKSLNSIAKIGVFGIRGRMGQWVNGLIDTEFEGRAEVASAPDRGDPLESLLVCDAVVDFSSSEGTLSLIDLCIQKGVRLPLVVGSTGFSPQERAKIESSATYLPLFLASNFSTGVYLLQCILEEFGSHLKRFGYHPAIIETHHVHKKDSPSGTALSLQKSLGLNFSEKDIPISSIRGGEVIGEHEIRLHGPGDTLSLTHRAQDRSIFARGAIEAALWMAEQNKAKRLSCRIYTMADLFRSSTN